LKIVAIIISPGELYGVKECLMRTRLCLSFSISLAVFLHLPGAACAEGPSSASAKLPEAAGIEYLGDRMELIFQASQAWGELGKNAAAHPPGGAGAPLQIAGQTYARGLGHHAFGAITILLEGQYAAFDAEVGLQPCGGGGSVCFRVFVNGQLRFDSGILRATDAARPVHVELSGAQELRLEAGDGGDGIACDMANWANARLTRSHTAVRLPPEPAVDMAPFARVVTWDPNRREGARASRIEEFRAEDLFLETDLAARPDGAYCVPVSTNGLGCIGLQWLNRRALKELTLEFAAPAQAPAPNSVHVQGWQGESIWQGAWEPLAGELQADGRRWVFRLPPGPGLVQTHKVRWIFPASEPAVVRPPGAFTRTRWQTVPLRVQAEKPVKGGTLTVYNGEVLSVAGRAPGRVQASRESEGLDARGCAPATLALNLARPLHLAVRSSRPSLLHSDPTVLQFRLPTGSFGVAVEDLLTHDGVYLPDHGLYITRDPAPLTLAGYRRKIAAQKSILPQVRELPEQTLAQAMARTHHSAQREGPVMLSLACDNAKFVLEREGTLRFQTGPAPDSDWFATAGEIQPQFGAGPPAALTRRRDGGWLPIPVITVSHAGVQYRERVLVAPADAPGDHPARLNRRSVCVAEFVLTNTLAQPAQASLQLNCLSAGRPRKAARLAPGPGGYYAADEGGPFALAATAAVSPLEVSASDGQLRLAGTLPAHAAVSLAVLIPAQRADLAARLDPARLRADTAAYWDAVLAPAMQVQTPDPFLNEVIRASQVRCLIAARNEAGGARIAPWIAAMSYGPLESEANAVIRGMDFMGHGEFARRSHDFFIHRYNTNGFLTTGYTTFGTAWQLWTLGEHYQLHRDANWLSRVAPEILRVTDWIIRQTEKTRRPAAGPASPGAAGNPEYGLMPPGVMADWNSFACHFAMNAYYYAALREVGHAIADLPADRGGRRSAYLLDRAAELRANLLRAYRWTQAQSPVLPLRDGTWIPHYPSQVHSPGKLADFFPGQDAGRSWCYDVELGAHQLIPTAVLDPRSREAGRMLDHMEDVQFLAEGWFDYPAAQNALDWFNLGGFSKVQPYYTRNCEVYALRDDVKPFLRSYCNALASLLNPEVLTFWEHFHHSGAWDKTHETGYFLHQTRTLLVTERGRELWLAPFTPAHWLADGQALTVRNAPTRFGPVSYTLRSRLADGWVHATIQPPEREAPHRIVLRLRTPDGSAIRSVRVNGRRHHDFAPAEGLVRLPPSRAPLDLEIRLR